MTTEQLEELFEKHNDQYLRFERVENRRSQCRDIHAFLLLEELVPCKGSIIEAAEHDEYWISSDPEKIAEKITEEQVIELIRCGVRWEGRYSLFGFFA